MTDASVRIASSLKSMSAAIFSTWEAIGCDSTIKPSVEQRDEDLYDVCIYNTFAKLLGVSLLRGY